MEPLHERGHRAWIGDGSNAARAFVVDQEVDDDAVVVYAEGDVDSSTVEQLTSALVTALELAVAPPGRVVVVDLRKVTYFGSAGLNAVLGAHQRGIAAGTAVRLVAANAEVTRPIEVTTLDTVLALYPTMPEALVGRHRLGTEGVEAEPEKQT